MEENNHVPTQLPIRQSVNTAMSLNMRFLRNIATNKTSVMVSESRTDESNHPSTHSSHQKTWNSFAPANDRPNKHASLDSSAQNADIARDDECHLTRTLSGAEASEQKKVIILITKDNVFDETSG